LYRRNHSIAVVTAILIASLLCALPATADEQSEQARLASHSLLLDITRANDRLVTIGERGHVLISDDNGQFWKQILVPTRSQLTAIYFLDDRHGWAVGHDAVILSTNDGGETWSLQHRDKQYDDPLLDIWFKDQNNGFAIGACLCNIAINSTTIHYSTSGSKTRITALQLAPMACFYPPMTAAQAGIAGKSVMMTSI
jgi:photosystem II stability/assembly factor-like uncharacterized protein